jgi:hypothetical protein
MDILKINLKFDFISSSLCLNKEEWTNMIYEFITKLNDNKIGYKFLNRLKYFLDRDYNLTIINKDDYSRSIYPKTKFINNKTVEILIPSVPYFTQAKTIDPKLFDNSDLIDISKKSLNDILMISKYKELDDKIKFTDLVDNLICYTNQSFFMTFVHELIHCLRFFENLSSLKYEEEATIYGIKSESLVIDGEVITENRFRKEFGLYPRICHDSRDIYIYNVQSTLDNAKYFNKESFLKI